MLFSGTGRPRAQPEEAAAPLPAILNLTATWPPRKFLVRPLHEAICPDTQVNAPHLSTPGQPPFASPIRQEPRVSLGQERHINQYPAGEITLTQEAIAKANLGNECNVSIPSRTDEGGLSTAVDLL